MEQEIPTNSYGLQLEASTPLNETLKTLSMNCSLTVQGTY